MYYTIHKYIKSNTVIVILLVISIIALSSCISKQSVILNLTGKDEKPEIFYTKIPPKDYTETEIIEFTSFNIFHRRHKVLDKTIEYAISQNADAIIITDYSYLRILAIPFYKIEAVLINYK
ncbi:MAG TPA: hypothetical protein PKN32_09630 [Bacteroidales bacterium]|nr:hypothetical protein [Bacteroidales bacterium]